MEAHFFDFKSKTFDKREQFSYCFEGTESLKMADFTCFCETGVVLTFLVLVVCDSVIAYDVNITLDGVLLAIACTTGTYLTISVFF